MKMLIHVVAVVLLCANVHAGPATAPADVNTFNYIIGTQTIGPSYHFTDQTPLVESAQAILDMTIKLSLGKRYHGRYLIDRSPNPDIKSLTDLVRLEPSHRRVLQMPFVYYLFWTNTFADASWKNGLSPAEHDAEYKEMYEFARHLLKTYNNTGKTFLLGHWEGDWLLRKIGKTDIDIPPGAAAGMIDWLNVRQQAVDDAKRDTPHDNVSVFNYTEVNLVRIGIEGKPCLTTEVLPKTHVDYVSYSSYDTEGEPQKLKAALSFIESHLQPKPTITGKRVFIGEYGFPAMKFGAEKQEQLSRQVIRAGLEWGCPFILYWEMYNNEVTDDGHQRGFWLIDDKNVKQPIYHTHQRFYEQARQFVRQFQAQHQRLPTPDEFRAQALRILNSIP